MLRTQKINGNKNILPDFNENICPSLTASQLAKKKERTNSLYVRKSMHRGDAISPNIPAGTQPETF